MTVNAGPGVKNLVRNDNAALAANDIPAAGCLCVGRYDATAGNVKLESVVASQEIATLNGNANTWTATNVFALSGATPLTVRRTENDTVEREYESIQSGSGAGNTLSWRLLGGGVNNIAEWRGYIGATKFIDVLASGAVSFPGAVTISGAASLSAGGIFAEIATPSAPAAGNVELYAKASGGGFSDIMAYETPGGTERLILGDATGKFLIASGSLSGSSLDISVPSDAQEIEVELNGVASATGTNGLDITYKVGGTAVLASYQQASLEASGSAASGQTGSAGTSWVLFQAGPVTLSNAALSFKIAGVQSPNNKQIFASFFNGTPAGSVSNGTNSSNTGLISDIVIALVAGTFSAGSYRVYKIK